MARNRKSESAAMWLGPALKAGLICLVIVASCVGYVWQKQQIYLLAEQMGKREARLKELRNQNDKLLKQLAELRSPEQLDLRVKELRLGLVPPQPTQIWYRPEPAAGTPPPRPPRTFAAAVERPDPVP
jgi:heme exporter protein D